MPSSRPSRAASTGKPAPPAGSKRAGRAATPPGQILEPAGQISAGPAEEPGQYKLRLYVAGQTPKSITAFANLKRLCEQYLPGRYQIEVIDLVENPQLAAGDQILALPTLVRKLPPPLKRMIGSITDAEKFLVGMDLKRDERSIAPGVTDLV